MTNIQILRNNNLIESVEILGHSEFGNYGDDVCCAAISAITFFTINGVDAFNKTKNINVKIEKEKTLIKISVVDKTCNTTKIFLELLVKHFKELKKQFPKNVNIKER